MWSGKSIFKAHTLIGKALLPLPVDLCLRLTPHQAAVSPKSGVSGHQSWPTKRGQQIEHTMLTPTSHFDADKSLTNPCLLTLLSGSAPIWPLKPTGPRWCIGWWRHNFSNFYWQRSWKRGWTRLIWPPFSALLTAEMVIEMVIVLVTLKYFYVTVHFLYVINNIVPKWCVCNNYVYFMCVVFSL